MKKNLAFKSVLASLVLSFLTATPVFADVRLASPFSDHMVLQRNTRVPVWGTADKGQKASVQLGKQVVTTTAGADGKWMVKLNKLAAGGPFSMTVKGKNAIIVKNVYAGEVWLCSGL